MADEEEFEVNATQSESKINYAGTKDHPADLYVDHDAPTLFDKREARANRWIKFIGNAAKRRRWGTGF